MGYRNPEQEIEYYNQVFDIFVKHADTNESLRENFVSSHTDSKFLVEEYRIQGKLGFGGKYRRRRNQVDCYKEDETPEVMKIIAKINHDIRALNGDIIQFKTGKATGLFMRVPNDAYDFKLSINWQITYVQDVPYKKSFLSFRSSLMLYDYMNENFEVLDVTDKLTNEQMELFLEESFLISTQGTEKCYVDYSMNEDGLTFDIKEALENLMISSKAYPLEIAKEWEIPEEKKGTWLVVLKK